MTLRIPSWTVLRMGALLLACTDLQHRVGGQEAASAAAHYLRARGAGRAHMRLVIGRDPVGHVPASFVQRQTGGGTARDNGLTITSLSGAAP